MELTDLSTIKRIMREYRVFAQKKLGQHFLINQKVLTAIIKAAKLSANDNILEIGPGLGTLTRALATKVQQIIAVEKDPDLIKIFKAINSDLTNVKIIKANALTLSQQFFKNYLPKPYKLVANLPYYLTSAFLHFFLPSQFCPVMMVIMVQQEVAERIVANPPKANLLSVAVQFYGTPEIICQVSRDCFWPAPQVDSAILRIIPHLKGKSYKVDNEKEFFKIVKAGFRGRRKQLHNALTKSLQHTNEIIKEVLVKSKINSNRRAQTLTIPEWIKLYQNLTQV